MHTDAHAKDHSARTPARPAGSDAFACLSFIVHMRRVLHARALFETSQRRLLEPIHDEALRS